MSTPKYVPIKHELSALGDRYPGLRNPEATANKAVKVVYDAFVKDGQPKGYYTGLKAVKAVLDVRPDLIGAPPKPVKLSAEEVKVQELGKRMGVKDPDAAMRRFERRHETPSTTPSLVDLLRQEKSRA